MSNLTILQQTFEVLALVTQDESLNSDFIYTITCRSVFPIQPENLLGQAGVLSVRMEFRHGFVDSITDEGRDEQGRFYWTVLLVSPLYFLQYVKLDHVYLAESLASRVNTWLASANIDPHGINLESSLQAMELPSLTTYGQNLAEVWAVLMAECKLIWFYEFTESTWQLNITKQLPEACDKLLVEQPETHQYLKSELAWQSEIKTLKTGRSWVNPGELIINRGKKYRVLATQTQLNLIKSRQTGESMPVNTTGMPYQQMIWLLDSAKTYQQPSINSPLWRDMPKCFIGPRLSRQNHWQLARLIGDSSDSYQLHYDFDPIPEDNPPKIPRIQPSAGSYLPSGAGTQVCVGFIDGNYSQPVIIGCLSDRKLNHYHINLNLTDNIILDRGINFTVGQTTLKLTDAGIHMASPEGGFSVETSKIIQLSSEDYSQTSSALTYTIQGQLNFVIARDFKIKALQGIQWSAEGNLLWQVFAKADWQCSGAWQQHVGVTWQLIAEEGDISFSALSGKIQIKASATQTITAKHWLTCRVGASQCRLTPSGMQLQAPQLSFVAPNILVF